MGYGWLGVRMSGYVYEYQHLEDEYIDQERALSELNQSVTMNKYNNELVFTVHKTALDNALYIFQKYHNSFSKAGAWEVVGFPTVELMNTGVMIKISVVPDGAENEVTYQLFSTPKIQARVVEDVGVKENLT